MLRCFACVDTRPSLKDEQTMNEICFLCRQDELTSLFQKSSAIGRPDFQYVFCKPILKILEGILLRSCSPVSFLESGDIRNGYEELTLRQYIVRMLKQ